MLRSLVAAVAVCVAAAPLFADDKKDEKIDPAKLVGKWKLTKASKELPPGTTAVIEFTKDGDIKLVVALDGKEFKLDGTYKVSGSKVETVMKDPGGESKKETLELVRLTEMEMHTKDEKGDVDRFERVKGEKKDK